MIRILPLLLLTAALLQACGSPAGSGGVVSPAADASDTVPAGLLARVDDRYVTDTDVDDAVERMLGDTAFLVGDAVYDKALDSLISLHAMASVQEQAMSPDALAALDRRVHHYREELLMEALVRERSAGMVVTAQEIQRFYDKQPELFGAQTVQLFETLGTPNKPDSAGVRQLGQAGAADDWQQLAASSGQALAFATGRSDGPPLDRRIQRALSGLDVGQVSEALLIDDTLLRIRVIEVERTPPRPLAQVRDEVRRLVAARKTRDLLKTLTDEARGRATILHTNTAGEVEAAS